jgi:hypothetical protein
MNGGRISRLDFLKLLLCGGIAIPLGTININKLFSTYATVKNTSSDSLGTFQKPDENLDVFGIRKIYPTRRSGREWFMNMNDPRMDPALDLGAGRPIKSLDGSWRIGSTNRNDGFNGKYHVVFEVITTPWLGSLWRDVEITGCFRILGIDEDVNIKSIGLQWYARGNRHNDRFPCEGTSLKARIHPDGSTGWIKEIWHTGGYTTEKETTQLAYPIIGKWIGWKAVMYNIQDGKAVKMESYVDYGCNNHWIKIGDLIDSGNWYSDTPQFYEVDCGRPRNYVVSNSGPRAGFRSDGITWDFKNFSVREILVA